MATGNVRRVRRSQRDAKFYNRAAYALRGLPGTESRVARFEVRSRRAAVAASRTADPVAGPPAPYGWDRTGIDVPDPIPA